MKIETVAQAKHGFARIHAEFSDWVDAVSELPLAPVVLVSLEGESLELTTLGIGSKMEAAQMLVAALAHVLNSED